MNINSQNRRMALVELKIKQLYYSLIREVSNSASTEKYIEPFDLKNYPKTNKIVEKGIKNLFKSTVEVLEQATTKEWLEAVKYNNTLYKPYLNRKLLTPERVLAYTDRNLNALKSFQTRKIAGMNLSDRVWRNSLQYRGELELGLDLGIKDGKSASELSRDLRQYLVNPDKLFRRVRDERGELVLSKNAKKYNPGQGVYRSSYKNAMRLTRTEINMAYRASDYEQNQKLDFVLGIEVRRSNRHYDCDICESLKGKYPKDFKFVGWHPQCYSDDTELMTDSGWKLFEDLRENDKILSLNPETRQTEWVKYVKFIKYHRKGNMFRFHNRNTDMLVTPDHKMIYISKWNGELKDDKLAENFDKNKGILYRSSEYKTDRIEKIKIGSHEIDFDLFCEFMAYYLSEGNLFWTRKNQIKISQCKVKHKEQYETIKRCLEKMPFNFSEIKGGFYFNDKDFYEYLKQFGKSESKHVPDIIKNSAQEQIKIFLDAYIMCDGYTKKAKSFVGNRGGLHIPKNDERLYFTSSNKMSVDIGEMILKLGKRPSYRYSARKGDMMIHRNGTYSTNNDNIIITECNSQTTTVFEKSEVEYDGFVYDIELEKNHIFYVRRNGKCVWGSNCRCHTVSILSEEDDFMDWLNKLDTDEETVLDSSKEIKDVPDNFKDWISNNQDRIERAKSKPYFIRDNGKYVDRIEVEPKIMTLEEINSAVQKNKITEDLFQVNGEWVKSRKVIHDQIIDDYFNQEKVYSDKVYMLGGATANGKSTVTSSGLLPHPKGALVIDADKVKSMLPEYNIMLKSGNEELVKEAANFVHEESSHIGKKIQQKAFKEKWGSVIDGINDGKFQKVHDRANAIRKATGKPIRADYVSLDTDLSLSLAQKRAEKTGRHVNLKFVADVNRDVSLLIPDVIKHKTFDELYLWDTNENGNPRLILKQINGKLEIINKELYRRFLNKAK